MNNSILLPVDLDKLYFSSYNYSGCANIVADANPMSNNWYYNNSISICCDEESGVMPYSPNVKISGLKMEDFSFVDLVAIPNSFIVNCAFELIYSMLQNGYYVYFDGVDDYYIEGKTNYHIRHSEHDGMITGYDAEHERFSVAAYSLNNKFECFYTPANSISIGINSILDKGWNGTITAAKPMPYIIELDIKRIKEQLIQYCDVSYKPKPFVSQGIAICECIVEYLNSCEYVDIRQFRMLWEHKKCMLDRIFAIENALKLTPDYSNKYKEVPDVSRRIMLLCEKYNMTSDRSIIPRIIENMREIKQTEHAVLHKLIKVL